MMNRQVLRRLQQSYAFMHEGKFEEALDAAEGALKQARVHLAEDHQLYLESLNRVAELNRMLHRYFSAEPIYRHLISIFEDLDLPDKRAFGIALNNLGLLYRMTRRFDEAEALYARCRQITAETVGLYHPEFATDLHNLADLYVATGRITEAKPLLRQAIEIYSLREPTAELAVSLMDLALLYYRSAEYLEAEALLERRLQIIDLLRENGHNDYVRNEGELLRVRSALNREPVENERLGEWLLEVALNHQLAGRYSAAVEYGNEAVTVFEKIAPSSMRHIESITIVGNALQAMGDYRSAQPSYETALTIASGHYAEHEIHAVCLNNLAELERLKGQYNRAKMLLDQCLSITAITCGRHHPSHATAVSNLGLLLYAMGDFANAAKEFKRAEGIDLEAFGPNSLQRAMDLGNLADALIAMDDLQQARQILETTKQVFLANGQDSPQLAFTFDRLANIFRRLRQVHAAESHYRQSIKTCRIALGELHPEYARALNNLGVYLLEAGRSNEARDCHKIAHDIHCWIHQTDKHPSVSETLMYLGLVSAYENDLEQGMDFLTRAFDDDSELLGQLFSIASERQRYLLAHRLWEQMQLFVSLVNEHCREQSDRVETAFNLALRRKCLVIESCMTLQKSALASADPILQQGMHALTTLRAQIIRKTLCGPGLDGVRRHELLLEEWTREYETMEAELASRSPQLTQMGQNLRKANLLSVLSELPRDSALIEIVRVHKFHPQATVFKGESRWGESSYIAFVVSQRLPNSIAMIDLGNAESIDNAIHIYLSTLACGGRDITSDDLNQMCEHHDAGIRLRKLVFDPMQEYLHEARNVYVATDGAFGILPVGILPTCDGKQVFDDLQLSYLTSGRDILRFKDDQGAPALPPIVIADPDFDLSQKRDTFSEHSGATHLSKAESPILEGSRIPIRPVERLPGTRFEADEIAKCLPNARIWMGDAALEGRLKRDCWSPGVLHVATHGHFLRDQPKRVGLYDVIVENSSTGGSKAASPINDVQNPLLRSWLLLSGFNTWVRGGETPLDAEDGILTAADVAGMQLLGTELVVLSACETGLGGLHAGEGVMGMRRSFALAGAKTLIMSLWKVPDVPTAILMKRFYENLFGGPEQKCALGRNEALQEAQSYVRDATVAQIRDPWLTQDVIERITEGNPEWRRKLHEISQCCDEHRPFSHPSYWGAFICQGDPGPMPARQLWNQQI